MDKLEIRICPPNQPQGELVAKVIVNDLILHDDDYCFYVDTFFSAIGPQESSLVFLGGCGVHGCCAEGIRTYTTIESWRWSYQDSYQISWDDVVAAGRLMISKVEILDEIALEYKRYFPQLPMFRERLELAVALAGMKINSNINLADLQLYFQSLGVQQREPIREVLLNTMRSNLQEAGSDLLKQGMIDLLEDWQTTSSSARDEETTTQSN